jgi:hypothetical protein
MRDVMLRNVLPVLCLIFLLPAAWAEDNSTTDIAGWQDTRWGMSPAELKNLYGDKLTVERQDNDTETFIIEKYELFGVYFYVRFFWKDSAKLSRVLVGISEPQTDLSDVAGKLLSSLEYKYGKGQVLEQEHTEPSFVTIGGKTMNVAGSNKMEICWLFPSTLITYNHLIVKLGPVQPGPSIISVTYEPNEAGKL